MGLTNARRALVVDTNPWNRRQICDVFAEMGYEVSACDSLGEAQKFYRSHPIVVVRGGGDGVELEGFVRFVRGAAGVIGGYVIQLLGSDEEEAVEGADDVIGPELDEEEMRSAFEGADGWLNERQALVAADEDDGVEIITSDPAGAKNKLQQVQLKKQTVKSDIVTEILEDVEESGAISSVSWTAADEASVSIRRGTASRRRASSDEHELGGRFMPEKTSKYEYNLLIENAPLAMAMFDGEMRYLIANGRWRKQFDLEESTVIGRSHFDIFSQVSARWQLLLDRARRDGSEVVGEEFVEWSNGTTDWVRWTMRTWEDQEGKPGGLVVSCGVITEEKARSGEQQFSSGLADSLMNSGVTPLVVLDFTGRVVRCNRIAKRWGDWGGVSGDDRYFWDAFIPAAERQKVRETFVGFSTAMEEDGEFIFPPVSVETLRSENGNQRVVAWTNTPRMGDGGVITGLVRVGVEIKQEDLPTVAVPTEGEVSDEVLDELQDEWMDAFPLMCWRTNSRGKIKFFNRQWLDFRGRNALEESDNGWMDGLHEEDYDSLIHAFDTAAKTGARVNHVARMLGGDGQYRWLRFVSARDFSDLEGESDGFVGYCEDLARVIRLENELSAARSRYEELLEDSTGAFQAKRQMEKRIAELDGKLEEETERLASEREVALAELGESLALAEDAREQAVAQLEAERGRFLQERDVALAELARQKDELLAGALASKDELMAAMLASKEGEFGKVLAERQAELERVTAQRQAELERVTEEKRAELARIELSLGAKVSAAEAELQRMREDSRHELEALRQEMAARVRELEQERELQVVEHAQGFATLKADFETAAGERARLAAEVLAEQAAKKLRDDQLMRLRKEVDAAHQEASAFAVERDRFVKIPENAPFGMVLIARDGAVLYSNPATDEICGVEFGRFEKVEDWLLAQAPVDGEGGRQRLLALWREGMWRQDGTKVVSMQTGKGLRELELKSKLLPDGQVMLSVFDVTDTRRAEEALRASEVKFRSIFYDSGVGMALVDKTGNIFDANPAQEKLMGCPRAELRKMHIEDCMALEEIAKTQQLAKEMAEKRARSGELTIRLQPKDKRPAWAHMNVSLVRDPDGEVIFAAYFFHDITAERDAISKEQVAAATLQSAEAEKRAIVEASPDLIVVVGADGLVENVVPPVRFPLHVDHAMEGRPVGEVIPPIAGDFAALAAASRASGGVETKEFSVQQESETFHFECRIAGSGEVNTVVVIRDVTVAKKAEEVMRRQALTFANIRDAIIVADLKGRINDWNPAAEAMFGYTREEAIGMGLYMLYDREDPKRFKETITAGIGQQRKWEATTSFHRKDGSVGDCEVCYTPLVDEAGRPLALVGVSRIAEPAPSPEPTPVVLPMVTGMDAREVHERMKQSVLSLTQMISMQEVTNQAHEEVRVELSHSRARLEVISLLHEVIEAGGNFEKVDFGVYVRKLVEYLLAEYGPESVAIEVHLNVRNIDLPVGVAQPLAVVLFELLSNSLRHAFHRRSNGTVGVSMGVGSDSGWLVVNDDGSGLPVGFDLGNPPYGAGLRIAALQLREIQGDFKLVDAADTEIQVGFRLNGAT